MKLFCLRLLIASASCFYTGKSINLFKPDIREKIIGGDYVPITEAPYQAQLLQLGSAICGATIISEYWLVSAAHCFKDTYGMSILTGSSYKSVGGEEHQIETVLIHAGYNIYTFDNDISLIKLVNPIKFNQKQKAIRLANYPPNTGEEIIISGYGREGKYQRASAILKLAIVPVVDQRICAQRYYPNPITINMFCAGRVLTDACQGDSGGPAVINGQLAGIVSAGVDCGSTYYPGIYTKVHNYYKWIAKNTGIGP